MLTNARLLQDKHLSGCISGSLADSFVLDSGITYFMTILVGKLPDSFCREPLFFGASHVYLKILVDLLADKISERARGLNDLSVCGNDLLRQFFLHIFDLMKILFHSVPGYIQFAGYFFVGLMEFVQVYDSSYICHRFHLTAHLSEYLEREGFPLWGGQKRTGVSLNWGVKIESANTANLRLV